MNLTKPLVGGTAALLISALLFALMDFLISGETELEKAEGSRSYLNFIRIDPAKEDIRTKDRRLPEPPPPPDAPPETPDFSADMDMVNTELSMGMPSIGVPMNDGSGPYLGTLQSGQGLAGFDTDVIPVVQIAPTYPRAAKQSGMEGSVTMEVLIRPDGTVSDVKVMESDPPRIFDRAAIAAMRKWKFRPKIVDGNPVAQRARQTIEFSLGRS